MPYAFHKIGAILILICLVLTISCSDNSVPLPPGQDSPMWDKIRELYEKARESGEKVPDDITDWVKNDVMKIGDWEYKVISIPLGEPEGVERTLNRLGEERWECFWVERAADGGEFYFKRPARSYLKAIPSRELLRFLPDSGGQ